MKWLFTPGPLTTSESVKSAMMVDYGSRDISFIRIVREIREKLLELADLSQEKGYEAVLMQGSGTFGIESMISSAIPQDGHLLLLINGAYGKRIFTITQIHDIQCTPVRYAEDTTPTAEDVERYLEEDDSITHVAIVHCETTTGIINPVEEIGQVANRFGKVYMVDAMSSFGAVPLDLAASHIHFLVSSANKCIEGVPGFSFAIAEKEALKACEGQARTLSLDLYAQWKGLEDKGQFRFTPPTHTLVAFHQALLELEEEGGVTGRGARYQENYETLMEGMEKLGIKAYLAADKRGYIITAFLYPDHPQFDFTTFYQKLSEKDFVIYPGKLTQVDCFRIGNIGKIHKPIIEALVSEIERVLGEMGVK